MKRISPAAARRGLPGPAGALLVPFAVAALLLAACGGGGGGASSSGPARSAAIGFTYFPYDNTGAALEFAFSVIDNDADLLVSHHDGGIPWDAAHDNDFSAYPSDFRAEIDAVPGLTPSGHKLYVATTPIAFSRDGIAPTRGVGGSQVQAPPWSGYAFDHPDVVDAFTNHCRIMIDRMRPDYFAFGIEANILRLTSSDNVWNAYLSLASQVYARLKAAYPGLPIFQTLHAESFYADTAGQTTAIGRLLPYTDYIAVSSYPFADMRRYRADDVADPASLPADYFSRIAALAPQKPFAISETAWPAEDVTAPYPVAIPATPAYQAAYVAFLLDAVEGLNGRFVNYYFTRDYDALWESTVRYDPGASLLRLWKDTGIYDGDGNARPALSAWRQRLAVPRR